MRVKFALLVIAASYSQCAFAYLDPGTGGMLLSSLMGIVVTLFFFLKGFYYKVGNVFASLFNRQLHEQKRYGIVFYSEGKQYWHTFKPVIEALDKRNTNATYLSSDQDDEGLKYLSDNIDVRYIGEGNKAYLTLNMLEADICILTTPGLDVLQIRRSKGVRHYCHLIHAPTTGTYKLYSFDYFDSVMCSGQHQIDGIRELESLRGTAEKLLFKTGCTYMDVLADNYDNYISRKSVGIGITGQSHNDNNQDQYNKNKIVLIAPSWGSNSLLSQFGADIISPLLDEGHRVILRPHPQSFVVEKNLLTELKAAFADNPLLQWDENSSGLDAMVASDIMISDFSGIVFDYAFIIERPVITVKFDINLNGLDANHMSGGLWEMGMLNKIGRQIEAEEINELPRLVNDFVNQPSWSSKSSNLREKHLFNYGKTGEVAADQIGSILQTVKNSPPSNGD